MNEYNHVHLDGQQHYSNESIGFFILYNDFRDFVSSYLLHFRINCMNKCNLVDLLVQL